LFSSLTGKALPQVRHGGLFVTVFGFYLAGALMIILGISLKRKQNQQEIECQVSGKIQTWQCFLFSQ
jgi:hypothetical protein